jgi:aminoglycoside phosphotransferase (APT) family kinase protein
LNRGLVDRSEITAGDLVLSSAARRNASFSVERRHGSSLFIKRPSPERSGSGRSLSTEAHFYELCRNEAPALAPFLAQLHSFREEPDGNLLILELLEGARPLRRALQRSERPELPHAPFQALGRALAALHDAFRSSARAGPESPFRGGAPQAFWLPEPHPRELRQATPARLEVLRALQGDSAARQGLDRAKSSWRVDTLIHGDVRSANVLVVDGETDPGMRLVDWEFAWRGDSAWDAGCVLADGLLFWLEGMELEPLMAASERTATAEVSLPEVRSALAAFWHDYSNGLEESPDPGFTQRAVDYAGARLLALAAEQCHRGERVPSVAVLLLQLGSNVLAAPQDAASNLFGLPEAGP